MFIHIDRKKQQTYYVTCKKTQNFQDILNHPHKNSQYLKTNNTNNIKKKDAFVLT